MNIVIVLWEMLYSVLESVQFEVVELYLRNTLKQFFYYISRAPYVSARCMPSTGFFLRKNQNCKMPQDFLVVWLSFVSCDCLLLCFCCSAIRITLYNSGSHTFRLEGKILRFFSWESKTFPKKIWGPFIFSQNLFVKYVINLFIVPDTLYAIFCGINYFSLINIKVFYLLAKKSKTIEATLLKLLFKLWKYSAFQLFIVNFNL